MPFHTYILESRSSNRLYIGQTNNLEDRLKRHNNNENRATKNRGPWKLVFSQSFNSRSEAVQLERKLKTWKNSKKVKDWVNRQMSG